MKQKDYIVKQGISDACRRALVRAHTFDNG